jgi:beta-phosphoglucomutase
MRLKTRPKAIIFDMDGVIVDSMPYHFLAWYEALRPLGLRVSCFDVYSREGERWDKSLKDFLKHAKIKPTKKLLEQTFRLRSKIFKKYFKRYIFKGAPKFLFCLKQKGYLLGLVTGTPWAEVQKILPKELRGIFDVIVSGDRSKKGKPHPEPYLKASRDLKIITSQCVVVENSPLGIKSAKSAGIFCIALTSSLPREYLRMADVVVDGLEEIPGIIEAGCRIARR